MNTHPGMNPFHKPLTELEEAFALLADCTDPVNEEFVKKHADAIEVMKLTYENRGGLHQLTVDDHSIIARIPGKEYLRQVIGKKSKTDFLEDSETITKKCLLYPRPEVMDEWAKDAPGIYNAFANKLFELSQVTAEAVAKKL